jgi:hypothetical protein
MQKNLPKDSQLLTGIIKKQIEKWKKRYLNFPIQLLEVSHLTNKYSSNTL